MLIKLLALVAVCAAEKITLQPGDYHPVYNKIQCDGTLTAEIELLSNNGKVSLLLVNEAICGNSPSKYVPSMSVVDVDSYSGTLEGRLSDSSYCYSLTSGNILQPTTVDLELKLFCNTVTSSLVYLYVGLALLSCPCFAWCYCRLRKKMNEREEAKRGNIQHMPLVAV